MEKISNLMLQKGSTMIVSIIVPVYRTELYLENCIESILRQKNAEFEIILVDDGSPDQCPKICDTYAGKYENIHVIHQQNQGVGMARNAGMKRARGEYVMFLDSDDMLDQSDAVYTLVGCAKEKHADIVTGGFRRIEEQGISKVNPPRLTGGKKTRTVDFRFKGFYMYGHLAYSWGKLYRKAFLDEHDLKFGKEPFMEDKLYNMKCCAYAPRYEFVDDSIILYRIHSSSETFRYKKDMDVLWYDIVEKFQAFLETRTIPKEYGDLMAFHIFFGSFFLVKQELEQEHQGIKHTVKCLKQYAKNPLVKHLMKALAKGRYVREIEPFSWKIVICCASMLFCLRAYTLYVESIAFLRMLNVDRHITKKRYRK